MSERPIRIIKGRGTSLRPQARYDRLAREGIDDGWSGPDAETGQDRPPRTVVVERPARTIISRN